MKITIRNRNAGKFYADGRRKSPNWEWRFAGASVDGKRKEYSKCGYKTKKEAEAAGAKALTEYQNTGSVFEPDRISVADYLWLWLDAYGKTNLKDTTIVAYRKAIKNHIIPEIGQYYLKDITAQRLQAVIDKMFNAGHSRHRLNETKGILSASFQWAVEPGHYIAYNPMVYVRLPSPRAIPETPTRVKKRRPVTNEEWDQIMQRFPEGHSAHIALVLAYRCGLRLGEAFGLLWDDIDLEAGTMEINRQIQFNEIKKVWEFTPPKYDSYRKISLDTATVALLKRTKDKQDRAKDFYLEQWKPVYVANTRPTEHPFSIAVIADSGEEIQPVMRKEDGELLHTRIMMHVGRVIHGKDGRGHVVISPDWDYHSLRHTHASMLVEAGIPMQAIQDRLGHAWIETTEIYTHSTESMMADLAGRLDSIYEKGQS